MAIIAYLAELWVPYEAFPHLAKLYIQGIVLKY